MMVVDPRIDHRWCQNILASLQLEKKLKELGAEVITSGKVISDEKEAVGAVADMIAQ